jgi:hypothetical protein
MEVFVDVLSCDGRYLPGRAPVWIDAGVGKVVPSACGLADAGSAPPGARMAVYHVEERRYLTWQSFDETSVRDFDTLVVVACDDPRLDHGGPIEAIWLASEGVERRKLHEARAKLRRFENGHAAALRASRQGPSRAESHG